jgi:hypothetical protein
VSGQKWVLLVTTAGGPEHVERARSDRGLNAQWFTGLAV